MASIPERFTWATELLSIKPVFNIIEIGCGAGVLADCIAEKLSSGKILAIDRSAAMIAKAIQRNHHHIIDGRAYFKNTEFRNLQIPSHHYDRMVAFNVNFFWKKSTSELALIRQSLKKHGLLFVFHQAPYEISLSSAKPLRDLLTANDFEIADVTLKKLKPTSAICVVGKVRRS